MRPACARCPTSAPRTATPGHLRSTTDSSHPSWRRSLSLLRAPPLSRSTLVLPASLHEIGRVQGGEGLGAPGGKGSPIHRRDGPRRGHETQGPWQHRNREAPIVVDLGLWCWLLGVPVRFLRHSFPLWMVHSRQHGRLARRRRAGRSRIRLLPCEQTGVTQAFTQRQSAGISTLIDLALNPRLVVQGQLGLTVLPS